MGRAMIGPGAVAALRIDRLMNRLTDRNLACLHGSSKDMKPAQRLGRILDFSDEPLERRQFSGVANLPAALTVEWRLVRDDLDRFADLGAFDPLPVLDYGQDDAFALV